MGISWAYFLTNYNGDLFIYNVSDFPTNLIQKKYINSKIEQHQNKDNY